MAILKSAAYKYKKRTVKKGKKERKRKIKRTRMALRRPARVNSGHGRKGLKESRHPERRSGLTIHHKLLVKKFSVKWKEKKEKERANLQTMWTFTTRTPRADRFLRSRRGFGL